MKIVDRLDIDRSDNLSFTDPAAVRLAAVPIKMRPYKRLDDFVEHMAEKIGLAVQDGGQLLCLPELIGLTPLSMVPRYDHLLSEYKACFAKDRGQFVNDVLYDYAGFLQEVYFTTFSELACQYGVYMLAGSLYFFEEENLFNRAYLFDPDGDIIGFQDKMHLSEDEVSIGVQPGRHMEVFDTKLGRVSVAIGQDNCYFEVYRIARGLGAQILLAPTCNLNHGCRHPNVADVYLRVQEEPVFAVKSALLGDIMHRHFGGVCGIYSPAQLAVERQGMLSISGNDFERPLVCRVNLQKLGDLLSPYEPNDEFLSDFSARHYDGRPLLQEETAQEQPEPEPPGAGLQEPAGPEDGA